MSTKSPIFPMPEPQHYSDYGFDPQIDYFQVLEEARRHSKRNEHPRSLDSIHFKLQKPISKDDAKHRTKSKKRKWWWKTALNFWKRTKSSFGDGSRSSVQGFESVTASRYYYPYRAVSGPVYVTESVSGASTPCRTSRPISGPLRTAEMGEAGVMPYLSLRDLSLTGGHRISASNASPMPIYLVT